MAKRKSKKKPRTKAQKAADKRRSKAMKGKNPFVKKKSRQKRTTSVLGPETRSPSTPRGAPSFVMGDMVLSIWPLQQRPEGSFG